MTAFCEVVVNRPIVRQRVVSEERYPSRPDSTVNNPLINTFSYSIPSHLQAHIRVGQLVEVPFREASLQGVIVGLADHPPEHIDPRPLTAILEAAPVVSSAQLELAKWLSRRYLAPLSDCVWLFLPPGIRRSPETVARAIAEKGPSITLDAPAMAMYLYLKQAGATPVGQLEPAPLQALVDAGLVEKQQRLAQPRVGPLLDRTVELIVSLDEAMAALPRLGRQSKQAEVLLHLAALDDVLPTVDSVLNAIGCGPGVLQSLADKGLVTLTSRETMVAPAIATTGPALEKALQNLSNAPAQRSALRQVAETSLPVASAALSIPGNTLAALEDKGYIRRWQEPATVSLNLGQDEILPAILELRGTTGHASVIEMLAREEGRVWVGWVYAETDGDLQTLRQLAEAGLVSLDETRRWRDPLSEKSFVLKKAPQLTKDQRAVWAEINRSLGREQPAGQAFLLRGVTGSGKTEIYLQAIAQVLTMGRGAIVLVPEIALAAQTIQRVAQRFPNRVAVWHSSLSPGERFDTWQRIRQGALPIVVGARSALFTPIPRLGLIVVDEEHEPAYKQMRSPRYHARDAALQLGRLTGATVVLGSATPDVTTMRRAERGELKLVSLPSRVLAHRQHWARQMAVIKASHVKKAPVVGSKQGAGTIFSLPLPPVEIVDLAAELKAGNTSIFSRALQQGIRETLAAGQQVILFLNRRGSATFVMCRDCGHVMDCSRCHMPLTFHAADEALVCHHCNRRYPIPTHCPECNSPRIRYFGLGTERVEETVRTLFPKARTLRWDQDTARARGSHQAFLERFASGQADILIGTQMIAKGLDMPLVTLVGIISADTALYLPDFRAAERSFQLLTQVAGRAGRSPLGGRAIIQTYHPDLPLVRAAAQHDYETFYQDELRARHEGRYPPFKRLARLIYSGSGEKRVETEAERLAAELKQFVARRGEPGVSIIGPAPCYYRQLRGQHRWHLVVRADEPEVLLFDFPLPAGWRVDVDPLDFL